MQSSYIMPARFSPSHPVCSWPVDGSLWLNPCQKGKQPSSWASQSSRKLFVLLTLHPIRLQSIHHVNQQRIEAVTSGKGHYGTPHFFPLKQHYFSFKNLSVKHLSFISSLFRFSYHVQHYSTWEPSRGAQVMWLPSVFGCLFSHSFSRERSQCSGKSWSSRGHFLGARFKNEMSNE